MVSSKTATLTSRLPNEYVEKIKDIAKQCKMPASQLMVHIVGEWLDKHGHLKPENKAE